MLRIMKNWKNVALGPMVCSDFASRLATEIGPLPVAMMTSPSRSSVVLVLLLFYCRECGLEVERETKSQRAIEEHTHTRAVPRCTKPHNSQLGHTERVRVNDDLDQVLSIDPKAW